jgi:hypothetical protein
MLDRSSSSDLFIQEGCVCSLHVMHVHLLLLLLLGCGPHRRIVIASPIGGKWKCRRVWGKAASRSKLGVRSRVENVLRRKWIVPRVLSLKSRRMIAMHIAHSMQEDQPRLGPA